MKAFLSDCLIVTITSSIDMPYLKLDKIYTSIQTFTEDLYKFCSKYDLRTDVEDVSENEYEISFIDEHVLVNDEGYEREETQIVGSIFVTVEIGGDINSYLSVRDYSRR